MGISSLKIRFAPLLLLCFSCSYIIETFQNKEQAEIRLKFNQSSYCKRQSQISVNLLGKNQQIQKGFLNFLKILKDKRIALTSMDKSILWALIQMNVRPDLSSPTARFQVFLRRYKKDYFWDFKKNPKQKGLAYPYLYGLERLTIAFKTKSLKSLAKLIDLYYPNSMFIDKEFEDYLKENENAIRKTPNLTRAYIRGGDILREGERVPKLTYRKLISHYKETFNAKLYLKSDKLFNFKKSKKFSMQCNFDMRLYTKSVFLISKEEILGNTFGLESKGFLFIGYNSQSMTRTKSLASTHLFQGSSLTRMPSACRVKSNSEKGRFSLIMVSDKSVDPGQNLYHLYQYGLGDIAEINDLDVLIRFSRHQFLTLPLRLIFESQRGTNKQLDELLKLNIPIYNSLSLGNVWSYIDFQSGKRHFLIDDRNPGAISCLN
jgi:hypothetical protein